MLAQNVIRVWFCLIMATASPAHDLKDFIKSVEHETRKPVYVVTLPAGSALSKGGFSSTAIYALMEPGATDDVVVHEVLHSLLGIEGYVATKTGVDHQFTGVLSGNVQDFILHPQLDRRAKEFGFPQRKMAEAHAQSFKAYLLSIAPVDETKDDRITLAARAMGFAEVIQRNAGPMTEISRLSQERLPLAFRLATNIVKTFPPQPRLRAAQSYDFARQLLAFLDARTKDYGGRAPSAALRIVNPQIEPPLDASQEAVTRQYMKDSQQEKH